MRAVSLFAMTGAAIVATGATILASGNHPNSYVDRKLLTQIDEMCQQGGGKFKKQFTTDEVMDEVSIETNGNNLYQNAINRYNATVKAASETHPSFVISYKTKCNKVGYVFDGDGPQFVDHWENSSNSNLTVEFRRSKCSMTETLDCDTTFKIKPRQ